MTKDTKAILKEWEITRWGTTELIKALGDEGLKLTLPRKGLDTFGKHFEEMITVQESAVKAIVTGSMTFDGCKSDNEYEGLMTAEELLEKMEEVDTRMTGVLADKDGQFEIDWFGKASIPVGHIGWLIMHEAFHFGQLIAFCYVLDVEVPESVVKAWALSGASE